MILQPIMRVVVCAALILLGVAGAGLFPAQPAAGQTTRKSTLHGAAALDQLKQDGQYDSLQTALEQARFSVSRSENTLLGRWAWHAPNPAAGYDAYVTEAGVSIALNDGSYVSLSLHGLGYGAALHGVATGEVSGDKQSIIINRNGGLREWFVNGADGLEHGFTLSEPPSGARQQGLPLRLALQVSAGWRAVPSEDGQRVLLRGANEQAVEYGKLTVRDKRGLNIPARLTVADEQVVIEVEDHNAEYPLTIDPLFTLQQRLLAADGTAFDYLGHAVALDGNTALIGAPADDTPNSDQGAAYVFVRNGATWTQQQKLFAPDGAASDLFGWSVALDGNTALVGAFNGPGAAHANQGAAYVFVRSGATQPVWTFQKKLTANDGHLDARFGTAVELDGDTALVGAPEQRVGTKPGQGAAYVFVRGDTAPNTDWTLQKQLTANDGEELDRFGAAVALDGDTALIGAPYDNVRNGPDLGSAYVFTRIGATWAQQQHLTDTINADDNDQFGSAVALSGDKILIGIPLWGGDDHGVVAAFNRGATGWKQVNGINEPSPAANAHFGASVALSGDTAVVGASLGLFAPGEDRRAAYAALYDGDWNQVWRIGAGLGTAADRFGYAVALDGATVLVGAYRGDAAATDQGAAYAFVLHDSRHPEQQKLTAHDGAALDSFGSAVALSGDTLAVGAEGAEGLYFNQGAVYVFTRNGAVWTFQQKLANTDAGDGGFGYAVALSGDTLAVGTHLLDRVYIYTRSGATWTFLQRLTDNASVAGDDFGQALALEGTTLLVGAPRDVNSPNRSGSVYVFVRPGAIWLFQDKLTANDGAASDFFGSAVALSGDTAVVGAPDAYTANQGAAYVFTRSGVFWTQQKKLFAFDAQPGDSFGRAAAVSGDTAMVGAPLDAVGANQNQGSVYLFTRNGTAWAFGPKVVASDGAANDYFGTSLALSTDTLVVGAYSTRNGTGFSLGAAYVFTNFSGVWTYQQKLTASDGGAGDLFGHRVALSGADVAVGAERDTIGTNQQQGSVYVYASPVCPGLALAPAALPNGSLGAFYSQTITASGGAGTSQFSLSAGALPSGLTLTQSGLLSGTPTATGTYRFTITTTFLPSGCTGRRGYTITVTPPCPPITVQPETLPDGVAGAAYNQTLTATGGATPYNFVVTAGALPAGLGLSNAGVLGGTPTQAGKFDFTLRATDANGCAETRVYTQTIRAPAVACVSAASYLPGAAPESIVAAFGAQLSTQTQAASGLPLPTELAGVRVRLRDSLGVERLAQLFFVSPGQINFQVPAGTAAGAATLSLSSGALGQVEITNTAPGLFAANADGQGVPAAVFLRVRADGSQSYEPVARLENNRLVPAPLDLGPAGEQVFLVLYGTGIRFRQTVSASVGGVDPNVLFAGATAGFAGLDQINLSLPRALAGRGEVDVVLRVDGVPANTVRVNVR